MRDRETLSRISLNEQLSENVTKRIFKAYLHRHRSPDRKEVKERGKPQDKNVGKGYWQGLGGRGSNIEKHYLTWDPKPGHRNQNERLLTPMKTDKLYLRRVVFSRH